MVSDQNVTSVIVGYFAVRSALSSGRSLTGLQLEALATGIVATGGRRRGGDIHARLGDLALAFVDLDEEEMNLLCEKYWRRPQSVEVEKLVPGRAGKMVLVSCKESQLQSDASCAEQLGMRSEHKFRRRLKATRAKVRSTLEAMRERREKKPALNTAIVQVACACG